MEFKQVNFYTIKNVNNHPDVSKPVRSLPQKVLLLAVRWRSQTLVPQIRPNGPHLSAQSQHRHQGCGQEHTVYQMGQGGHLDNFNRDKRGFKLSQVWNGS